jgi:spore germination protein KB
MNYTKLGNFEAVCLIVILFINHLVLNLPQMILDNSANASTLNSIYILALSLLFVFLVLKLLKNFTGLDIIDISEYLGGKFLKILVGILCIIYLIIEASFLVRMFSKNLLLAYFNNYPISFIIFMFLFVVVVANLMGRKSIIKVNTMVMPVALFSILFTFVFVANLLRIELSLPIFADGANTIFITGASNIFAFNGLFFLFFISPLLDKKEDISKVAFSSTLICGIFLILSILALVFAFSDIYSIIRVSPLYFIIINSKLTSFLERPEIIFIFIWALALMSFLSVAVMFVLNIFKKLTNTKNVQNLAVTVCTIIFVISLLINNVFTLEKIANFFYKYASLILIFGIFTLILIGANIKKRKTKTVQITANKE